LEDEPNDRVDDIVQPNSPSSIHPSGVQSKSLFYCECRASFIRWSNYPRHLDEGNHKICLSEVIKSMKATMKGVSAPPLPEGWAMGSGRKTGRYPETTKAFIKKKFDEFAAAGHKLKADVAEELMRADRFIEPRDWMTRNQLKNYINVEMEPQEEDLSFSEENFHGLLTIEFLKKFFDKVDDPIYKTPIPNEATEFD
ncbi:hypothetical protein PMAYCL1PPCAC_05135, partial [Pristionchus mayeri]